MKRSAFEAGIAVFLSLLITLPSLAFCQSAPQEEKLSLNAAVATALQHNPAVLRAQNEIDAAGGRVLQAGRIPNPELGVSWNGTPTNFNVADADEFEAGITQEIEFPTKRSARVAVAETDEDISRLQLARTQALLIASVKKVYFALLYSQVVVRSLEEQSRLLKDFQHLVTSRFEAGSSNYLDVVRSKVEIARTANDITEASREALSRATELNLLMGRDGATPITLTDSLSASRLPLSRDVMMQQLLEKSNALKIATLSFSRQQGALHLARTGYLPDFSLGVSRQRTASQPPFDANSFTGTTTTTVGLSLGVSIPLWFWQEPRGQVQEAEAQAQIARVDLDASEREVRTRLLNAFKALDVAESQLTVFDASLLADAKDILATGIMQYRNNQTDVLNLLDIYRTYRATNIEYARALTNYCIALAELEAASEQTTE